MARPPTRDEPMLATRPHPAALVAAAAEAPGAVAVRRRTSTGWEELDRAGVVGTVAAASAGFARLGVGRGDRIAVFADTCAEWYLAALAVQSLGGIVVGIYPTSPVEQVRHLLADAGATVVVAGSAAQAEVARAALGDRAAPVVVLQPAAAGSAAPDALPWADLVREPADPGATDELAARTARLQPEDPCTVVYTSGTTGPPKGVLHSYRSISHVVRAVAPALGYRRGEEYLVHLPLSHTAEHTNAIVAGTALQWVLSFGSTDSVVADLPVVRPTVLFAVPRILEKVAEAHRFGRAPAREALRSAGLDRARVLLSGGAPLPPEVEATLAEAGLVVRNIYGMTEGGGIAATFGDDHDHGTVGRPLPGVEVRLARDGEVLVRSDGLCCGYQGDPAGLGALTDDDGFLRTGDLGAWTERGDLRLVGRKRDIIVNRAGKNIAPAPIEAAIEEHPSVARAVVIGEGRPYLVALVEPADPATRDRCRPAVEAHVARVNATLSRPEQIKRFHLLAEPLRVEDGLLTATMKVRRDAIAARYADVVEGLYR